MLDLTRTDEFLALGAAVRAVTTDRIAKREVHPDRAATAPADALAALDGMGLLAPRATADGGEGIPDHLAWTAIAEELGRGDAGTALDVLTGAYAAIIVARCGRPDQRAGSPGRGCLLYFEGYGRSPLELASTATRDGDGWRLAGRKSAVVRAGAGGYRVVIARDGERLRALRLPAPDPDTGPGGPVTATLGVRAAGTSTVELAGLTDARELDGADEITLHRCLAGLRLAVASILIGTGAAAVAYAADYAAHRQAFGRAIADFQGVAFPLADADTAVESARLSVQDLAAGIDDLEDPAWLADATARAVAGAAQAGTLAAATAVNTLGGHGYLTDHPVERWYRDAAALSALDVDPLLVEWSR